MVFRHIQVGKRCTTLNRYVLRIAGKRERSARVLGERVQDSLKLRIQHQKLNISLTQQCHQALNGQICTLKSASASSALLSCERPRTHKLARKASGKSATGSCRQSLGNPAEKPLLSLAVSRCNDRHGQEQVATTDIMGQCDKDLATGCQTQRVYSSFSGTAFRRCASKQHACFCSHSIEATLLDQPFCDLCMASQGRDR